LRLKGWLSIAKHFNPRISTLHGIKIDSSDGSQNMFDSIRAKNQFDSNVIGESESRSEKQFDSRISTFLGIKID
jgi:hypothetical protein